MEDARRWAPGPCLGPWGLVAWVRCGVCSEPRAASWLSCVFWVMETSVQQQVADHKQQKTTGDASFPATNMDICLWRTLVRLLPAAVPCFYCAAVVSKTLLAIYGRQQVVLRCVSCVVPGKYRFFQLLKNYLWSQESAGRLKMMVWLPWGPKTSAPSSQFGVSWKINRPTVQIFKL